MNLLIKIQVTDNSIHQRKNTNIGNFVYCGKNSIKCHWLLLYIKFLAITNK